MQKEDAIDSDSELVPTRYKNKETHTLGILFDEDGYENHMYEHARREKKEARDRSIVDR
jgi:hypothetical protein